MEKDISLVNKRESLIYDLIFSKHENFDIIVSDYILDIYTYDKFINQIKVILKKANVIIIKEKIKTTPSAVFWKIKVKK